MINRKGAKILLFDIETFPNIAYTWGKWEQNVIDFKREWELASFAYKWLGEKQVTCFSRRCHSEEWLVHKLHGLLSEADVMVAHNGDSFDIPKARAKFIQFKLRPPAINRSVDTKKIAKSQFAFNSNSLNDLGRTLGLGKKAETGGFDLWLQCMKNNARAWQKMERYNIQDVQLLEKVYLKLRSWAVNLPNVSKYLDRDGCPACGSHEVWARGYLVTLRAKIQRFQCRSCGHWFKGLKVG